MNLLTVPGIFTWLIPLIAIFLFYCIISVAHLKIKKKDIYRLKDSKSYHFNKKAASIWMWIGIILAVIIGIVCVFIYLEPAIAWCVFFSMCAIGNFVCWCVSFNPDKDFFSIKNAKVGLALAQPMAFLAMMILFCYCLHTRELSSPWLAASSWMMVIILSASALFIFTDIIEKGDAFKTFLIVEMSFGLAIFAILAIFYFSWGIPAVFSGIDYAIIIANSIGVAPLIGGVVWLALGLIISIFE